MNSRGEVGESAPPKKPYRSPVIHVYGDIRTITRNVGQDGNADGGALQNKNSSMV